LAAEERVGLDRIDDLARAPAADEKADAAGEQPADDRQQQDAPPVGRDALAEMTAGRDGEADLVDPLDQILDDDDAEADDDAEGGARDDERDLVVAEILPPKPAQQSPPAYPQAYEGPLIPDHEAAGPWDRDGRGAAHYRRVARFVRPGSANRLAASMSRAAPLFLVPLTRLLVPTKSAERRDRPFHVGARRALAEKVGSAQRRELFRDGDVDELVEGRPLRLGNPLGLGLERGLQSKFIVSLRHGHAAAQRP